MNKKLITTNTDLAVTTSTAMIVTVGAIKFVKDEEYPWVDVFLTGGEVNEFLIQDDTEEASKVIDLEDLKVFAINWVFQNVKVAKAIEIETAPEVPVQEQPVNKNNIVIKIINILISEKVLANEANMLLDQVKKLIPTYYQFK